MSFDKKYPNRKDWRKQFRGSKRFVYSCRNHGSCSYCENNRRFFDFRKRIFSQTELNEFYFGENKHFKINF